MVWIVADQTKDGSESCTSFRQVLFFVECGFGLHDTMIWDKGIFLFPERTRYYNEFEYMFVFSKEKINTSNLIADRRNLYPGKTVHGMTRQRDGSLKNKHGAILGKTYGEYGVRGNVWHMPPAQSNTERTGHPAQFPLALARDHIITWSNEGDTVLDPFLGSGTTRIAAYDLNRNFIGFEIDESYFKMAQERFETHTAQANLFVNDGEYE